MKRFSNFIKSGIILTISTLILRSISIVFNIFLSNKISIATIGYWGIIMSIFSFLLTIALSRNKFSFYKVSCTRKILWYFRKHKNYYKRLFLLFYFF